MTETAHAYGKQQEYEIRSCYMLVKAETSYEPSQIQIHHMDMLAKAETSYEPN